MNFDRFQEILQGSAGIETDLFIIILAAILLLMLGLLFLLIRKLFFSKNIEAILSKQLKSGNNKEVIRLAREYMDKNTSGFFVLYYLAQAYEMQKNWVNALKYYQDALKQIQEKNRLYTDVLYHTAQIYRNLGKQKEALSYYLMILEKDDSFTRAIFEIASYHYENKNYKKAREYLEAVLQKRPGLIDARFLYGKILFESANYAAAIKQFALLEKYDSNNYEVYYYKACVLEASRQYTNAISAYQKTIGFDTIPQSAKEQCQIAVVQCYIRLKEYHSGIEVMSDFLSEENSNDTKQQLIYLYANLLMNTGEEYQSLKNYERVYRMNFQFKDVQIIYEKYKNLLPHSFLAHYFTSNEEKFLFVCQKILGKGNFNLLYRSTDFYLFSKGVFYIVFFRHIEPPNFSKLTDIEIIIYSFPVSPQGLELYSLQGISENSITHALLKKAEVIARDEFIGIVKDVAEGI